MGYFYRIILNTKRLTFYGIILALLIFSLKWLEWKFLIIHNSVDIYIGLIAIFFTFLGIWIATQLARPGIEKVIIEKQVFIPQTEPFEPDAQEINNLRLTQREYQILQLISKGHSNADIADCLFLSISTVKTHVSNVYVKMNVKRRGQAIDKARRLKIVD